MSHEQNINLHGLNIRRLDEHKSIQNVITISRLEVRHCIFLTDFAGCPDLIDTLYGYDNSSITTLEGMGSHVSTILLDTHPALITLQGCPRKVDALTCTHSSLQSLQNGPQIVDTTLNVSFNPHLIIKDVWTHVNKCLIYIQHGNLPPRSGLLGLLRIPNLHRVSFHDDDLTNIINSFLPLKTMSSILCCKQNLKQHDFKDYATF